MRNMKKRELQEVLAEMYADEKGTLLNLFCFHLISADVLMDAEACRTNLKKLEKFETFLEQQEDSEKKTYYQKFAKDGREIIEREATKYEEQYTSPEEDPFYNKENMAELERRVKDIESGNATLTEHELMEE